MNIRIDHVAIWTLDIERLKDFYITYFNARAGEKYVNSNKNFTSYFLSFESGCRLELMHIPTLASSQNRDHLTGLAHLAISVGSKQAVHDLTERLRQDGYEIVGEPRTTGDGYYESIILDPDGNRLEITV